MVVFESLRLSEIMTETQPLNDAIKCVHKMNMETVDKHHATIDGIDEPQQAYITPDSAIMLCRTDEDPLHLDDQYGYREASVLPIMECDGYGNDLYCIECGLQSHQLNQTPVDEICESFGTDIRDIEVRANPNASDWPVVLMLGQNGADMSDSEWKVIVSPYMNE